MKILVTGADGFTGRHFISSARALGHTIHALAADLTQRDKLNDEVRQAAPDAVVHLAAISFVGHADEKAFYEVNVLGTLNLLAAVASLPAAPRAVLLASSANIYGNCDTSPIAESQAPMPVNHYATSKLAMEFMARTYLPRLPLFFTRPFNYTGAGQSPSFLIPKLVTHFAQRAPMIELGNLDIEREFNDVRFVCAAYLHLLEKAQPGEAYNICSGTPMSLTHVIEMLSRMTGHTPDIRINPAFVRSNEVRRLCGDPQKLHAAIGLIEMPKFQDTLRWMLDQNA